MSEIGRRGEGDEADRRAPHGSDVRERRRLYRNVQSQRKHTFRQICQGCLGRMGISRDPAACGAKRASAGWAGPKSEEDSFSNKNWIFEYTKALEICTRRFRRNFDMRVFPKIF
jgi:hypothetical protein